MNDQDLVAAGEGATGLSLEAIDFSDSKIGFAVKYASGRSVLDLGCVMHTPKAIASRYFMHRALKERASRLVGLDLYAEGVADMQELGFDVRVGDAENFKFDDQFDVIIAGDIIEHLGNADGF